MVDAAVRATDLVGEDSETGMLDSGVAGALKQGEVEGFGGRVVADEGAPGWIGKDHVEGPGDSQFAADRVGLDEVGTSVQAGGGQVGAGGLKGDGIEVDADSVAGRTLEEAFN